MQNYPFFGQIMGTLRKVVGRCGDLEENKWAGVLEIAGPISVPSSSLWKGIIGGRDIS